MRILNYDTHFLISWEFNKLHSYKLSLVKGIGYTDVMQNNVFVCEARYGHVKDGKKYWYVPGKYRQKIDSFLKIPFLKAEYIHHSEITSEIIGEVPAIAELDINLPWKEGVKTRPYQDQGIAQALKFKRVLIGDEQGLGKTLQSIGVTLGLNATPTLVVCPASTKYNWEREYQKFSNLKTLVLDGKMSPAKKKNWHRYVESGLVDVVIVNFESVKTFFVESYPKEKTKTGKKKPWKSLEAKLYPFMNTLKFQLAILDESHRCKDSSTDQAKFVMRIFHEVPNRILLSGTSVINKPIDLLPQLCILGVIQKFGGIDSFKKRYCEGGNGSSNLRELNYLLRLNCYFRREKKDVAKDLPEKQRQTIICDISNREEYLHAENQFKRWLEEQGFTEEEVMKKMAGESILKIMELKRIAAKGKMNEVKEFVNEVLESGNKLILFCNLHSIVHECLELWPDAVTVTGMDNDGKKRQANIDKFQNDPKCQLIVCNIKAAGVGITLTASSRVAFIEYPWTYADCVQCEDRAHRIGQVNNVMCTYFLGKDTVDERIWELIMEKMEIGNIITGATDMMQDIAIVDKTTLFG
jgi:SWI/SNF-related matrix-associated actin-dependent regulator 1 of chromatin subfamily A